MDLISKYDLIEKIVNTQDETLLSQVKQLLEDEEIESWETLDPALKASVKRGLTQADKGELSPHSEVMKRVKKKHGK